MKIVSLVPWRSGDQHPPKLFTSLINTTLINFFYSSLIVRGRYFLLHHIIDHWKIRSESINSTPSFHRWEIMSTAQRCIIMIETGLESRSQDKKSNSHSIYAMLHATNTHPSPSFRRYFKSDILYLVYPTHTLPTVIVLTYALSVAFEDSWYSWMTMEMTFLLIKDFY